MGTTSNQFFSFTLDFTFVEPSIWNDKSQGLRDFSEVESTYYSTPILFLVLMWGALPAQKLPVTIALGHLLPLSGSFGLRHAYSTHELTHMHTCIHVKKSLKFYISYLSLVSQSAVSFPHFLLLLLPHISIKIKIIII